MVKNIFLIMLSLFQTVFIVSQSDSKVSSFLKTLSSDSATKKTGIAKTGTTDSEDTDTSFLKSLRKKKKKSTELDEQKQEDELEQQNIQDLDYLTNFYGNPKYQSAMKILNDSELQESYSQSLNSIQMFFFQYSQKVLSKYHTVHKKSDDNKNQDAESFLASLQKKQAEPKKVFTKNGTAKKVTVVKKKSSSKVTAFLATLKG